MTTPKPEVGLELPALEKRPSTRQLVQYAGASGDFYEIHYDLPFAQNVAKLPGIIVHGLLKVAWLGQLVTDWAGPNAMLRHLEASYRGTDVPGDLYRLKGTVTGVEEQADSMLATLEIWGESEAGQRTTLGSAAVEFPR